jgi:hypothetical protein
LPLGMFKGRMNRVDGGKSQEYTSARGNGDEGTANRVAGQMNFASERQQIDLGSHSLGR